MSLTLIEPDYIISGNGLPKLNHKKYKIYDKKSYRSKKVENREPTQFQDKMSDAEFTKQQRLFDINETRPCYETQKLLSRRQNMSVSDRIDHTKIDRSQSSHNYYLGGIKSIRSDKELKCAINQKIKLNGAETKKCQRPEISNKSNQTLDNRLVARTIQQQQKCSNEKTSVDCETDCVVLSTSLDF